MQAKKIVIIGASSSIAAHCARRWCAASPEEIILVGRNLARIEIVAADLQVRAPQTALRCLTADFSDPLKITALAEEICAKGCPDIVLIAHGSLPEQTACQNDLQQCRDALEINGISPVLFAEAFVRHLQDASRGTLAMIGSVAGDRGRKSNYVYGAAKGLLARYAQGLQHRLAGSGVKVVLIKPGPTATPMTAALGNKGMQLASVESVAETIVRGIEQGKASVYAPFKWAVIMLIIRSLPDFIFNKMEI